MQWLCDGVGYFRGGRMACRCGVRIPDVKRRNNSKFYFSNVALFLGPDKYECLATYLETVYAKLNSGLRTTSTGKDERGNEAYSCSLFTDKVGCMDSDLEITDAGGAACANASAAMEPPPSHLGCCSYCENRRVHWFDRGCCKSAHKRTLFRASLLAHRMPPGAPAGAAYTCPAKGCNHKIDTASETVLLEYLGGLSATQLAAYDLAHRKAHAGVMCGKLKLLHVDHIKRAPSLLHLQLNGT
jgi:hypothetical protein